MEKIFFDAALTEKLASRLYCHGRTIVIKYIVICAVLFSVVFYFASAITHGPGDVFGFVPAKSMGVGLLLGVVVGFIFGQEKACKLKLDAQIALCQVEIEKNTRTAARKVQ